MKPDYEALARQFRDAIGGGPEALPADEGPISEERQHEWLTQQWAPWIDRLAAALVAWNKAHDYFREPATMPCATCGALCPPVPSQEDGPWCPSCNIKEVAGR